MMTPDIKVITGDPRCDKSKLKESFIAYVKDNDANFVSFTSISI